MRTKNEYFSLRKKGWGKEFSKWYGRGFLLAQGNRSYRRAVSAEQMSTSRRRVFDICRQSPTFQLLQNNNIISPKNYRTQKTTMLQSRISPQAQPLSQKHATANDIFCALFLDTVHSALPPAHFCSCFSECRGERRHNCSMRHSVVQGGVVCAKGIFCGVFCSL